MIRYAGGMFFQIHRMIGVVASIYVVVISVSGVALLFQEEISEFLCPSPKLAPTTTKASLSSVIKNTERSFPGYRVTGLSFPPSKERCIDVFASKEEGIWIQTIADPYTGCNLGLRKKSELVEWIRDLHFNLLLGSTGRSINASGAASILILVFTGLGMSWTSLKKSRARLPDDEPSKLQSRPSNTHSRLGNLLFPFLILQSISGMYFGFPTFFQRCLNVVAPVSSIRQLSDKVSDRREEFSFSTSAETQGDIDQLILKARSCTTSAASIDRIAFPDRYNKSIQIWFRNSPSRYPNTSKTKVCISETTGNVVSVDSADNPMIGDAIIQWMISFHCGTLCGALSRCLWFLLGLTPVVLAATGISLFLGHRKAKQKTGSALSE